MSSGNAASLLDAVVGWVVQAMALKHLPDLNEGAFGLVEEGNAGALERRDVIELRASLLVLPATIRSGPPVSTFCNTASGVAIAICAWPTAMARPGMQYPVG